MVYKFLVIIIDTYYQQNILDNIFTLQTENKS